MTDVVKYDYDNEGWYTSFPPLTTGWNEKEKWLAHAIWCGEYDAWTATELRAHADRLFPDLKNRYG